MSFQELLSLAKRKRVDSEELEEPISKPAASTDSETSDSDDEVLHAAVPPRGGPVTDFSFSRGSGDILQL